MQELKAIFFDLDNVLVFSERMHFYAWQQVMQTLNVDPHHIEFKDLVGIDDTTQSGLLKKRFSLKEDTQCILELKRQTFLNMAKMGFDSAKGRNTLLEKVSNNLITAVVSSSCKSIVEHTLQIEKIDSFFNFVIAYEDCERHKPDPLPYKMALEKAKILPHQALIIEDSVSGIRAAQQAKIPVIGLLNDQTPEQVLNNVKYFNHFEEIDSWLIDYPYKSVSTL